MPIDHCNAFNYIGLLKLRGDLDMEIGSDAFVAFWLLSNYQLGWVECFEIVQNIEYCGIEIFNVVKCFYF